MIGLESSTTDRRLRLMDAAPGSHSGQTARRRRRVPAGNARRASRHPDRCRGRRSRRPVRRPVELDERGAAQLSRHRDRARERCGSSVSIRLTSYATATSARLTDSRADRSRCLATACRALRRDAYQSSPNRRQISRGQVPLTASRNCASSCGSRALMPPRARHTGRGGFALAATFLPRSPASMASTSTLCSVEWM